eukprot:2796425-Amphidinium_carterae.1
MGVVVYTLYSKVGVPVPGGFSTTSYAYKQFLDKGAMGTSTVPLTTDPLSFEDFCNITEHNIK